jgi:hypothetical protein
MSQLSRRRTAALLAIFFTIAMNSCESLQVKALKFGQSAEIVIDSQGCGSMCLPETRPDFNQYYQEGRLGRTPRSFRGNIKTFNLDMDAFFINLFRHKEVL